MTTVSTSACNFSHQEDNSTQRKINFCLEYLNYAAFNSLFPLVVLLIVIIIVGFCGNLLVFSVYFKQFDASATRVFVLAMSACDLLTNVFLLNWLIHNMRYKYTKGDIFCKFQFSLATCPIFMSFQILVCVALDRRRRICQIHKRQLNARQATYLLIFPFILVLCIVCPFAVLYGAKTLETDLPEIKGTTCGFADTQFGRKVKIAYGATIGTGYGVGFALLTFSYMQISRKIYHQKKKIEKLNITALSPEDKHKNKGNAKNTDEVEIEFQKNTPSNDFETTTDCPDLSDQKERMRLEMTTRDVVERPVNVGTCSNLHHPQDISARKEICYHDEHNRQDVYRRTRTSKKSTGPRGKVESTSGRSTPECSIKNSIQVNKKVSKSEATSASAKKISASSVLERFAGFHAKHTGHVCSETTQGSQDLRFQKAWRKQRRKAFFSKTTLMMLVLSVATLVVYVPYITVV